MQNNWYTISNPENLPSPSLLVYPERIAHNIDLMLQMAGGPKNLRPHIKTHKSAAIIQMQLDRGITKFKCATIAEAELLAQCQAPDVLLAIQPVGPNIQRFFQLQDRYPHTLFSTLVDNMETLEVMVKNAAERQTPIALWVDINNGMDRSGVVPEKAFEIYKAICESPQLQAQGLHVYDGHLRQPDITDRTKACDTAYAPVRALQKQILKTLGCGCKIVAGGSPTFPIHAQRDGIETSPGTTLLWDGGYGSLFNEMDFLPAAVLFGRIISRPTDHKICLDLGHKAMAPEMPLPRVEFLNLDHIEQTGQSEEHLILKCRNSADYPLGMECYAIPKHICPTVAKYDSLIPIVQGAIQAPWPVGAQNRKITI